MRRKIGLAVFGAIMIALVVGIARAQINVTLTLTDENNNPLGSTVSAGTTVYVHAFYQDVGGSTPATAVLVMEYNGTIPATDTTLYNGTITSGQTITESAVLTKPGTYLFTWTCTQGDTITSLETSASRSGSSGIGSQCVVKVGYITATVEVPLPEPGTIAGLAMALSAFGLIAIKKAKR
jgi:hypothetical protein